MPYSPETIAVKPYNKCIKCDYLGVKCDGPNVIAMSKERFCEWCRQLKEERGWSNAKLAEVAEISKATIDKMMSGRVAGLNGETISTVACALIYGYACPDGNWGQFPCAMVAPDITPDGCPKCEEFRKQLETQSTSDRGKIDFLKKQLAFAENQILAKDAQIQSKDERLAERKDFIYRKDRIIAILGALLGLCVLIIIGALVVDMLDPNIGFFWVERMFANR